MERVNRFLKEGIQLAIASRLPVKKFLQEKVNMYNSTTNSVTGHSPFFLMRGRSCKTKLTPRVVHTKSNHSDFAEINDTHLKVQARIKDKQLKSKLYHDKIHRAINKELERGDWVIVKKQVTVQKGESKYTYPVEVATPSSVLLHQFGWRSKSDVVKLKPGQRELLDESNEEYEFSADGFLLRTLIILVE